VGLHKDEPPDNKEITGKRMFEESAEQSETGEEESVSDKQRKERRKEERASIKLRGRLLRRV
jgi:hypothetical protein